jgi:hypothetical protein
MGAQQWRDKVHSVTIGIGFDNRHGINPSHCLKGLVVAKDCLAAHLRPRPVSSV